MGNVYKTGSIRLIDVNNNGVFEEKVDSINDLNGKPLSIDSERVKKFMSDFKLPQMEGLRLNKLFDPEFREQMILLKEDLRLKELFGDNAPSEVQVEKENGLYSHVYDQHTYDQLAGKVQVEKKNGLNSDDFDQLVDNVNSSNDEHFTMFNYMMEPCDCSELRAIILKNLTR